MNSSDKDRQPDTADLSSTIKAHGEGIHEDVIDDALAARLDKIEFLVEQYGKAQELQSAVAEYIDDLRAEQQDIRNFRFWITLLAVLMATGLVSTVAGLIIIRPIWFILLEYRYQATLLFSFSTLSVVVLTVLLKGVFRARAERNHDEVIPEHLKFVLESLSVIRGK